MLMLPRLTSPPPEKPLSRSQLFPSASTKGCCEPASIRIALADDLRAEGMVAAVIFVGRVVGEVESAFSVLRAPPTTPNITKAKMTFSAFMTSFLQIRLVGQNLMDFNRLENPRRFGIIQ